MPVTTVRRYLRYLELSNQTLRLEPWSGNRSVRLVRSPKLFWLDAGVQRILSGQHAGLAGEQYENAIVTQIVITLSSLGVGCVTSYLRTSGGLQVDLIVEPRDHLIAIEIKNRPRVDRRDAAAIERARRLFVERYLGGSWSTGGNRSRV